MNKFTEKLLASMQKGRAPNWRLQPCQGEEDIADYEVQLSGEPDSMTSFSTHCRGGSSVRLSEDYGLIVRGPHPKHPHRMVTIMAGPHSLGTGAACLAVTKSGLVLEITRCLEGAELTARDRTFWVLVKAVPSLDDHLDAKDVQIVRAGVYPAQPEG